MPAQFLPTTKPIPVEPIEYVKLWQDHSIMMWSRLQSVALLHTGILVGWYTLQKENHFTMANLVLILGLIISSLLLAIMVRDTHYMDELKKLSGDAFPTTEKSAPSGRHCGYLIVISLMVAEILLLGRSAQKAICAKQRIGATVPTAAQTIPIAPAQPLYPPYQPQSPPNNNNLPLR